MNWSTSPQPPPRWRVWSYWRSDMKDEEFQILSHWVLLCSLIRSHTTRDGKGVGERGGGGERERRGKGGEEGPERRGKREWGERERDRQTDREVDWLIDWILFLNGEDISTKADSHICRCYNTTNNQDIHSEILWQRPSLYTTTASVKIK